MRACGEGGRAGRPGGRLRSIAAAFLAAVSVACGPTGQETPTWTVSSDGEEVATVRVPDGFVPLDVDGDRVLGVARGPLDVERVVVRRVER